MPKPKDIGLIFDVTLENTDELLSFRIRPDDSCCVNVTPDVVMGKMGRLVGGDFGFIEPEEVKSVSLILPTASLYNRVGLCPIAITSTNIDNEELTSKRMIKFDTRFKVIGPDNYTLRKQKLVFDCQNWDKDYFKDCTPVDCEKSYFGLQNFYNSTSEKCEDLPQCSEKSQLYDIFSNKCMDRKVTLSDEDLKNGFTESKYSNNEQLIKVNEGNWFDRANKGKGSSWMYGLLKGLLIVFATIVIYILICFAIFLFVKWISRKSNRKGQTSRHSVVMTHPHSRSSVENIHIYTTSSLMSQR